MYGWITLGSLIVAVLASAYGLWSAIHVHRTKQAQIQELERELRVLRALSRQVEEAQEEVRKLKEITGQSG